jgi:hypothetical protein
MTPLHYDDKVWQSFNPIKEVAKGAAEDQRREAFRESADGKADFWRGGFNRRSLDGVNIAPVLIGEAWTHYIEKKPSEGFFDVKPGLSPTIPRFPALEP